VTDEEYWGAISRIPLYRERDTSDGKGVICRTFDNQPVQVDKPDGFDADERRRMVEFYRLMYSPSKIEGRDRSPSRDAGCAFMIFGSICARALGIPPQFPAIPLQRAPAEIQT
jgi:hypothetical protein